MLIISNNVDQVIICIYVCMHGVTRCCLVCGHKADLYCSTGNRSPYSRVEQCRNCPSVLRLSSLTWSLYLTSSPTERTLYLGRILNTHPAALWGDSSTWQQGNTVSTLVRENTHSWTRVRKLWWLVNSARVTGRKPWWARWMLPWG